ncbi:uncharacterized protein DNG_06784 [Cephalotrichum gorgonifer]|uniref:Transmembrane protein n=1 Tax=Cephalotrichum gorgonifer TaxID=2041049 RepID=A0AAE8N0B6_9PEZI|nr:uncharacterized protein DNG_06784 [Cephalotrichum gorgonifer]
MLQPSLNHVFWVQILLYAAVAVLESDDVIGFYVDGTTTFTAKCFRNGGGEPLPGPGCLTLGEGVTTRNVGLRCMTGRVGPSLVYQELAGSNGMTATGTETAKCECISLTVYDRPPNIGSPETTITCAGEVGVPKEARTLYRALSVSTTSTDVIASFSTESSASHPTDGDINDVDSEPDSNKGVIAGAVVGSIAGICLLVGTFFMGQRIARRRYAAEVAQGMRGHGQGQGGGDSGVRSAWPAELGDEKPSAALWAKLQGVFGRSRFGGPLQPPAELESRPVEVLDGRVYELPGQYTPGELGVYEGAAVPGATKESVTSVGDTPTVGTPKPPDTAGGSTPNPGTTSSETTKPANE